MEGFREIEGKKTDGFEPPYDFIILDVHLPLDDTPLLLKEDCSETTRLVLRLFEKKEIMPEKEIEAGFALYFLLVMEMGFPASRIVFLSAHAEAETIRNNFRQVKAAPPTVFLKNSTADMKAFVRLLEKNSSDSYMRLRRAVYDGCDHLLKNSYPVRYNRYVHKNNELALPEIAGYMGIMQSFLPDMPALLTYDPKRKPAYLHAFIRFLLHSWGETIRRSEVIRQKGHKMNAEENALALSKILKNVRNWSAHSNLFDDADEKLVDFLFLINTRVMFSLPENILPYERQALRIWSDALSDDEMKRIIDERAIPLAKTYQPIRRLSENLQEESLKLRPYRPYTDSIFYEDMLASIDRSAKRIEKRINDSEIREDIKTLIFRMFWHCLSWPCLEKTEVEKSDITLSYSFNYHDYGVTHPDSFLFQLSRHIYNDSFC